MTNNNKYSLGIYVNRNFASNGGSGNPHVFLGLKIEKVKYNELQMQMKKEQYHYFLKNNLPEQANQCKIELEIIQCFINESILEDLRNDLSKNYKYTFVSSKEYKVWQDVSLRSLI